MKLPDLKTVSKEELIEAMSAIGDELDRRALVKAAESQAKQLIEQVEAAMASESARELGEVPEGTTIAPGGRLVIDGVEWMNQSGAWLSPHTAGPEQYPMGWKLATPPAAESVPVWKPGEAVLTGDKRSYQGIVFKCLQGHTTQPDWTPTAAAALWAEA